MDDFSVIYEDNHLLVVNKKAGQLVQGDRTGDVPLVDIGKAYIKKRYSKPGAVFLGVVHRIDRPVSGLVVFARTSKALSRMNELFRNKETQKVYWAISENAPPSASGELVHWLSKDSLKNKTTAYAAMHEGAQRSELKYTLLAEKSGFYFLEVRPRTGRPHQIRVQLASMGCPIVGDKKYGSSKVNADKSICLHARRLSFLHPVQKVEVSFLAELPVQPTWQKFEYLES